MVYLYAMFDSSLDILKLIMVARNFEVNIEAVAQRCSVKKGVLADLGLQLY